MQYTVPMLAVILTLSAFTVITHDAIADAEWQTYQLSAEDQTFRIPYKITNGGITEIEVDHPFAAIFIHIESTDDGLLEVIVPRELLRLPDYKEPNILLDGQGIDFEKTASTLCSQTYSIQFNADSELIEILGGYVGMMPPPREELDVPPVHVTTNKQKYEEGELISILGCTSLSLDDKHIVIEVLNPEGKIYHMMTVFHTVEGYFTEALSIDDEPITYGTYTVRATYAGKSAQTEFEIRGIPPDLVVSFGNTERMFNIKTSLTNGNYTGYEIDVDSKMLTLFVETSEDEDGVLEVLLHRSLIDAKENGEDAVFMVLIDGSAVEYQEIDTSSTHRTLSIPVPAGAQEVQIIGTHIIPEFPVAIIVASVGIGAMITIMRLGNIQVKSE